MNDNKEMLERVFAFLNNRPKILNYILYGSMDTTIVNNTFGPVFERTIPLFLAIRQKLGYNANEKDPYFNCIDNIYQNEMLTEIWEYSQIELVALLASTNTLLIFIAKEMLLPSFNNKTDLPIYNGIKRGIARYMYETEADFIRCYGNGEDIDEVENNCEDYEENENITLPSIAENQIEETKEDPCDV